MNNRQPVVLVVEDEFLLRLVARMVEDAGFRPSRRPTRTKALSILWKNAGRVWLLFTDVQIAGLDVRASLAHARARPWPRSS